MTINPKTIRGWFPMLLCVLFGLCGASLDANEVRRLPNVVLILVDDK